MNGRSDATSSIRSASDPRCMLGSDYPADMGEPYPGGPLSSPAISWPRERKRRMLRANAAELSGDHSFTGAVIGVLGSDASEPLPPRTEARLTRSNLRAWPDQIASILLCDRRGEPSSKRANVRCGASDETGSASGVRRSKARRDGRFWAKSGAKALARTPGTPMQAFA